MGPGSGNTSALPGLPLALRVGPEAVTRLSRQPPGLCSPFLRLTPAPGVTADCGWAGTKRLSRTVVSGESWENVLESAYLAASRLAAPFPALQQWLVNVMVTMANDGPCHRWVMSGCPEGSV